MHKCTLYPLFILINRFNLLFCIEFNAKCNQYVAEVRRKDWKKCCPFDLSSYSPESTFQAERVFVALILEDNDALINTPENTQAPNCKQPELGQAAESETHIGEVIGNDATSIINDTPLESASGNVTYTDCQIEKVIFGDMVAAEIDKPEDVVDVDHSLKDIVTDGASKSSSRKLKDDVQYQNENSVCEDIIDAGNETHIVQLCDKR
uniref:Uncharacterized protein n=1 Tax=Lactuca sativa TaxID=4236 RepID=A0A9R1XCB7_LACSA|nr:hypothetical protein LSAT_V11C400197650 [Lactuca sativa]